MQSLTTSITDADLGLLLPVPSYDQIHLFSYFLAFSPNMHFNRQILYLSTVTLNGGNKYSLLIS